MKNNLIECLSLLRLGYRNCHNEIERRTFVRASIPALTLTERLIMGTPDEWTHLPIEDQLSASSSVSDHLSVTRRLLGLCP